MKPQTHSKTFAPNKSMLWLQCYLSIVFNDENSDESSKILGLFIILNLSKIWKNGLFLFIINLAKKTGVFVMKFQESESIELKRTLAKDFVKEVVAFLNTRNGIIYIGVDDNGNVVGVSNIDKTMREIRDIIRD